MSKSIDSDWIAEEAERELVADEGCLAGRLGEAIATESGNYSLEFCTPSDIARGVAKWIEDKAANHCEGCRVRVPDDAICYDPDGIYLCKNCIEDVEG